MMSALVSVTIPTYNSEKTIEICSESIRNQSYKNVEIIVVDRFFNDKTAEIAESYEARIYQLDCEMTRAKNFGLRRAGKNVLLRFVVEVYEVNVKDFSLPRKV